MLTSRGEMEKWLESYAAEHPANLTDVVWELIHYLTDEEVAEVFEELKADQDARDNEED
jgi:hypothetical protein